MSTSNSIYWLLPTSKKEDLPDPRSLNLNFEWQTAMAYDIEKSKITGGCYLWVCKDGKWSPESVEYGVPIISSTTNDNLTPTVNVSLPIDEQLLKDALQKWGHDAQILVAIEECAELITALSQTYRASKNPNVITEIADVLIMAHQLRLIFGCKEVDEEILRKQSKVRGMF